MMGESSNLVYDLCLNIVQKVLDVTRNEQKVNELLIKDGYTKSPTAQDEFGQYQASSAALELVSFPDPPPGLKGGLGTRLLWDKMGTG